MQSATAVITGLFSDESRVGSTQIYKSKEGEYMGEFIQRIGETIAGWYPMDWDGPRHNKLISIQFIVEGNES